VLDFGKASTLVKSRKIGGTYSIGAAVAIWTMLGETSFLVSLSQDDADYFLSLVERHLKVLAALGSEWAAPARKLYVVGKDTLRVKGGGEAISMPTKEPARSRAGNVVFDEAAYYQAFNKIWDAAAPAAMLGDRLRVLSTPNGAGGLFHEMCESNKPAYRYWRRHKTTLDEARAQGYELADEDVLTLDHGIPSLHEQLFQCSFIARSGSLFHGVRYFDSLPKTFRRAIGLDFAYTQKTRSDYNVAVVMRESEGRYYVEEVVREKTPDFAPYLKMLAARFPGVRMHHYPNVAEAGMDIQLFRTARLPVYQHKIVSGHRMNDRYKFTHALPLARAWNARDPEGRPASRVLLPESAPWLAEYVTEFATFNGEENPEGQHDDMVDATVAAFLALSETEGVSDEFGVVRTHFRSGDIVGTPQGHAGWMRW
jgi:phage terminase large subunit-like protein